MAMEEKRGRLKKQIAVSMASDSAKGEHMPTKFVTGVYSYVDYNDNGELQKYTDLLEFVAVNQGQTGELIEAVQFARFQANTGENTVLGSITTDSAKNFSKAGRNLAGEENWYPCACHRADLAEKDATAQCPTVLQDINDVRVSVVSVILTRVQNNMYRALQTLVIYRLTLAIVFCTNKEVISIEFLHFC